MPILDQEIDCFPDNLFDLFDQDRAAGSSPGEEPRRWWAMYTMSRREKELMRRLHAMSIPFYGPVIPKRSKTPGGRVYTSYEPLFRNYVFLYGTDEARYQSMTTNCVSTYSPVVDGAELTRDLRQFRELIKLGVALTPEARLIPGQHVRIRSGQFRGFEGTIIRREREVRLLVSVNFIQKGASILLDDFQLEAI